MGSLTVVGLGPAGADLLVPAARAALAGAARRVVRTRRHPAVTELETDGLTFESFDAVYDRESDLTRVYATIVDTLVVAAQHDDVVYAVPGNPVVAERTVELLRERSADGSLAVALRVVPGLSFADLAWAHVGVDPLGGARVVDARAFDVEVAGLSGPLLIAQCDTPFVLSDVKLALLEVLDAEHDVVVLQRLGLPDEHVAHVMLEDLDRVVDPDHLTSVFVDTGDVVVAGELERLWQLTLRLRRPGGCPWDAQQTHHSLARHTLEEAYEVIEAIEALPVDAPGGEVDPADGAYAKLEDELGDLLFQVMIHSALAIEAGEFTVADVARRVHDKLVFRHPHVFGEVTVDSPDDVVRNWEQIKQREQQHASVVDGLPAALPALLYTPKLYRKLKVVGLDPAADDPEAWLAAAIGRLTDAPRAQQEAALGEVLAAVVAVARAADIDAEAALRGFSARTISAFRALEAELHEQGTSAETLAADDPAALAAAWRRVRAGSGSAP